MSRLTPPEPNTLRVGLLGTWNGLDPWEAQDLAGVMVRHQCFEGLYTRVDGKVVPDARYLIVEGGARPTGLRTESASQNGLSRYSLRIADNLRFCDGSPVLAEDVVASLQRVAPLRAITNINAAGGRVQFHALEPNISLEPHLAQIWSVIGKRGAAHWVGTGPYAIVEEVRGTTGRVLTLERNPHWIAGSHKHPTIERVEFHAYPLDPDGKPNLLRDAIESGEIDFTLMLPRELAKGLQGVRKVYQPGQSTAILAFGCQRPWLDDPAVRRALSAAIDPWAIAKICHDNPAAFAARGLLPPALAPTQRSLPRYGHEVALEALEQIDSKPASLRMLVIWGPRPYLPDPIGVAERIAEQFGALGITVAIDQAAGPNEFIDAVQRGEHDLILYGYIAESPDPVEYMAALLSSKRIPRAGTPMASTTNLGGFADAEMDRRLSAAQQDPNLLLSINELFEHLRPLVPLMYGASVAVHAWRVRDFELDPRAIPSFSELSVS